MPWARDAHARVPITAARSTLPRETETTRVETEARRDMARECFPRGDEGKPGRASSGAPFPGKLFPVPDVAPADLLTSLLRDVSRSFYLTLSVLPRGVRRPIGLAYLLARATDTIADTDLVPVPERLEALDALRARILGKGTLPLDFASLASAQCPTATAAERTLLLRVEEAVSVLRVLDPADLALVREVLSTIAAGQELDLLRFGTVTPGVVRSLANGAELDDYTYRVAGCVGEFWTRICRVRLFPRARLDEARLLADGVRFGKGLQLVNILRDIPRDLRGGRCYLPADGLAALGLAPGDLLDPANEPRVKPLYDAWLRVAEEHLAAGWRYTTTLPRGQVRVRLACAWPVLLGILTLEKLKRGRVLDPSARIKVGRPEVRAMLWATVWRLPLGPAWNRLDDWARKIARPREAAPANGATVGP
ncbi:MAG: squalene/phytoene synthase family protein [Verrucomicrobia bacterium]|nr:MAG: squalene/phytoene synthase family protein [Verrucomicrobiota bacterium]